MSAAEAAARIATDAAVRIAACAGVVLDLDGTLALGDRESRGYRLLPGARELLATLRRRRIPFVIFTNGTHHTPLAYVDLLHQAGIEIDERAMLTPAVVAADYFVRKGYRRILVLGGHGVSQPLLDAGLSVVRPDDGGIEAGADATFVGWHPGFALQDIEAACRLAWTGAALYTASSVPFFATRAGKAVGISGAICAAIKSATGQRVNVLGKPAQTALRFAARRLDVRSERLVVVGDDPSLEVQMARAGGACAVGVLTGLATAESFARSTPGRQAHLVVPGVADLLSYFERSSPAAPAV